MFIAGNLIAALAHLIDMVLTVYMWVIVIRAVLSWVSPDPYNPVVRLLYRLTEPVLARVRRLLPLGGMGIDFSPMAVILAIVFLQYFLVPTLLDLSLRLR